MEMGRDVKSFCATFLFIEGGKHSKTKDGFSPSKAPSIFPQLLNSRKYAQALCTSQRIYNKKVTGSEGRTKIRPSHCHPEMALKVIFRVKKKEK